MKKTLVSILLISVLIITVYFSITMSQLEMAMNMFSLKSFIVCLLICFISYILRSFRYHLVIGDPNLTLLKLLPVIMQYQFFVRILPLKSGEFTLLYLLNKHRNIDIHQSANSLIFVKVIDLISILFLFLSLNATSFMNTKDNIGLILTIIFILNIMSTAIFMRFYVPIFEFAKDFLKKKTWRLLKYNIVNNILGYKRDFSMKDIILISINTSTIWISVYVFMLFLIQDSITIPILKQIEAITFAFIGNSLPINGIGGFGTQEAAWTIGFMQKDVDYSLSLLTGVYANVISFLYSAIFGVVGWLYLYKIKENK